MVSHNKIAVAAFGLAALVVIVFFSATGGDWDPPEPEIESVDVVESGCHEDIRARSASSPTDGWVGTVNETSPHTEVSAEIRLTSPDRADVITYRVDVETHNTSVPAPEYDCSEQEGAILYEVEYDAPYDETAEGLRVERYRDGELKGCGGSTSGPELGCPRLYEDATTHWSNESGQ